VPASVRLPGASPAGARSGVSSHEGRSLPGLGAAPSQRFAEPPMVVSATFPRRANRRGCSSRLTRTQTGRLAARMLVCPAWAWMGREGPEESWSPRPTRTAS